MEKEARMLMYDTDLNKIVSIDPEIAGENCKEIKNHIKVTVNPRKFPLVERNAEKYNKELSTGAAHIFACKDCGEYVYLSESESKWYVDHGYDIPKRCKDCRHMRKELAAVSEKNKENTNAEEAIE